MSLSKELKRRMKDNLRIRGILQKTKTNLFKVMTIVTAIREALTRMENPEAVPTYTVTAPDVEAALAIMNVSLKIHEVIRAAVGIGRERTVRKNSSADVSDIEISPDIQANVLSEEEITDELVLEGYMKIKKMYDSRNKTNGHIKVSDIRKNSWFPALNGVNEYIWVKVFI